MELFAYKKLCVVLFLSCLFMTGDLSAQAPYADFKGAIYDAQSGAAVLNGSPLAIYTNPGDLIYSPELAISASAKNYFFGEDNVWSGILAASFALSKKDALGVGVSSLGNSASRYLSYSVAYAHKLGKDMGLGVTFHGNQYSVSRYNSDFTGSIDIGFRAAVYPFLHLEMSLHNPYEIGEIEYAVTVSSLHFQLLYELSDKLQWTTAIKKGWDTSMSFHTALAFQIVDQFILYAGGGVSPSQVGIGLRYNLGKVAVMTSSRYRAPLGFSPSIEMEYKSREL